MAEITKGIGFVPVMRGAWVNSVTYYPQNIVTYGGESFYCVSANQGQPPKINGQVSPKWSLFVSGMGVPMTEAEYEQITPDPNTFYATYEE